MDSNGDKCVHNGVCGCRTNGRANNNVDESEVYKQFDEEKFNELLSTNEAFRNAISVVPGRAMIRREFIDVDRILNRCFKNNLDVDLSKKKRRGQNKKRPRSKVSGFENRAICLNTLSETECPFGDTCKYTHDLTEYWNNKPPDLEGQCPTFILTGKCKYGIACVFARSHTNSDLTQMTIDSPLGDITCDRSVKNTISVELISKLRKKSYDFTRSIEIVNALNRYADAKKELATTDIERFSEVSDCTKIVNPDLLTSTSISNELLNLEISQRSCANVSACNGNSCTGVDKADALIGAAPEDDLIKLKPNEQRFVDFSNKLYLAPLTTLGNLPFRRVCKEFGVDITCSEMTMAVPLLNGHKSEWALLKRHPSETLFGAQVCGLNVDTIVKCTQLISQECDLDFIDLNIGCPIDIVYNKGGGCALMKRRLKFESVVRGMIYSSGSCPVTVKMRTGVQNGKPVAHSLIPLCKEWGVSAVSLHGRSREGRYSKLANWDYIAECQQIAGNLPFFGCGDIFSFQDYNSAIEKVDSVMIGRGALIKPWLFTEIRDQRHWDISSGERFDILKKYVNYGLEHWGCDVQGVETTRRFLLEWMSFLHRYVPVGVLEQPARQINHQPIPFIGRDYLETLFSSVYSSDWVKVSEMLLGPVPETFLFEPKHKANSYG